MLSEKDSGLVVAFQLEVLRQTPFWSHWRVSPDPSGMRRHRLRSVPSEFLT